MIDAADLAKTVRALKHRPLHTLIIISILAVGVGLGTALFSVSDALLLRPLPFDREGRLMDIQQQLLPSGSRLMNSHNNIDELRERSKLFEGVTAYRGAYGDISINGVSGYAQGMAIDHYFFPLLGVAPALGRGFTADDQMGLDSSPIILSYAFWQNRFAGDQSILGKSILFEKRLRTVVGVMPETFNFPFSELATPEEDFWVPLQDKSSSNADYDEYGLAKLRPELTLKQAQAELAALSPQITQTEAAHEPHLFVLIPYRRVMVSDYIPLLSLFIGIVISVLMVVCINVASLLLVDVMRSRKEIEIRFATGATRWQIAKVFLLRSVVLMGSGGLLGVFFAWTIVVIVRKLLPAELPEVNHIFLNVRLLWCATGVTVLTGMVSGVWPALSAVRKLHSVRLNDTGRPAMVDSLQRSRSYLVVLQLAFSTTFLVVTGLLGVSLYRLLNVRPGFQIDHRLVVMIRPNDSYFSTEELRIFYSRVEMNLLSIPGVESVAASFNAPLGAHSLRDFRIKGLPLPKDPREWMAQDDAVEPAYFQELGIAIGSGRYFNEEDRFGGRLVAIVNESFAKRFFGMTNPLGQQICIPSGNDCLWREIVGIASDARDSRIDALPSPTYFVPFSQAPSELANSAAFVVKTTIDPEAVLLTIQRRPSGLVAPSFSMGAFTLEAMRSRQMTIPTVRVWFLAGVATVALLLAAMGVYGIIAGSVEQRRQEIGIRVALGAAEQSIAALFARRMLFMLIPGLLVGIAGTLLIERYLASILVATSPFDPVAVLGAAVLVSSVATVATIIPIRRALRVNAAEVLRAQ